VSTLGRLPISGESTESGWERLPTFQEVTPANARDRSDVLHYFAVLRCCLNVNIILNFRRRIISGYWTFSERYA